MQSHKLYASRFGGSAIIEAALTLRGLDYESIDEDFEKLGVGLVPRGDSAAYREFLRRLIFLVANVYPTFTYGDFPQRWVSGPAAQDELVAATSARRKAHWRNLETVASGDSWLAAASSRR